ncbi:putative RNase H-like nuclease (RuvC/YqgF family) [Neobacillus ginsengisoli]|uniref:RNase H-like nuclease (RuvC/YqgF family) n=1 Tax=Neobacillus ginsengisoli TaxID=904295 RepID=A0ABT9XXK5_9BACI|nr:putative RNase H-like nuclease (RuvC/YqgF family) [Neobacillus ginsengisoli]
MMDQTYIDNSHYSEIKILKEEVELLQERVCHLRQKIDHLQRHCKHLFLETAGMRECQKCGFSESTYY